MGDAVGVFIGGVGEGEGVAEVDTTEFKVSMLVICNLRENITLTNLIFHV